MPTGDLERIFLALERANVRYLVVGGVAVVLHGHPRLTADLDLVIALDADNVRAAAEALRSLGYTPRAPVSLDAFADPAVRREWIEEKGLTVLSLASPELPLTEVHLFAAEPFPFDAAYRRALRVTIGGAVISVAGLENEIRREDGFERARREQRRAWLRTTAEQRIAWLEQAKRFAAEALAAARRRNVGSHPDRRP
jgi:hypothetical protein